MLPDVRRLDVRVSARLVDGFAPGRRISRMYAGLTFACPLGSSSVWHQAGVYRPKRPSCPPYAASAAIGFERPAIRSSGSRVFVTMRGDSMLELRRSRALVAVAWALAASASAGQEPSGPPPPSRGTGSSNVTPHELLPDIGKIGAQVAMFAGGSWNPYQIGRGVDVGGYIDLPLSRAGSGKLSYEIFAGLSLATSQPFETTNAVAFIANLAAGATRAAALAGPPAAPFPVTRQVRTRLRLLHFSPFSLKYSLTAWDRARLRPYVNAGVDFVVALTRQDPARDESLLFTGTAPFDDALIAGLLSQAPELTARGYPSGQGNLQIGGHAAAGVEVRLTRGLSLNLEYRFTSTEGSKGRLHTASSALGFHF
jgi:hypothetical protein